MQSSSVEIPFSNFQQLPTSTSVTLLMHVSINVSFLKRIIHMYACCFLFYFVNHKICHLTFHHVFFVPYRLLLMHFFYMAATFITCCCHIIYVPFNLATPRCYTMLTLTLAFSANMLFRAANCHVYISLAIIFLPANFFTCHRRKTCHLPLLHVTCDKPAIHTFLSKVSFMCFL